uniref:Uncharacterized protein n=1 Tax=Nicotiana tabacum TaxID=4097 RepID=A0A1S4A3P0_TOBAC|nr:PREDICTED: uncharacterized protein LOC107793449 [Nicotiana tabacum]
MPFSEEWNMKRTGKDAILRPSSVEEEALASVPKPVKDNKRKRAFVPEKKEAAQAQLSSAKDQLQSIKEKGSVQARRIEELEARFASELAKAESDAEKAKTYADALMAQIKRDKELETDAESLAFDDDDDDNEEDDESKSGFENGGEPGGEETASGDSQET